MNNNFSGGDPDEFFEDIATGYSSNLEAAKAEKEKLEELYERTQDPAKRMEIEAMIQKAEKFIEEVQGMSR